ncbi:hypothetical protein E2C01_089231 [Portunus trituberculatus]|uniref:Uncharacterized protein n=1 Tax=Portunus trituberculatus TaxID=210409 RepID=A0A5B7JGP0_PORTR|nr:hypothetical protein [Portunus trituberculatus]
MLTFLFPQAIDGGFNKGAMAGSNDNMSNSMVGFGSLAGPGMPDGGMGGGGSGGYSSMNLTAKQRMVLEARRTQTLSIPKAEEIRTLSIPKAEKTRTLSIPRAERTRTLSIPKIGKRLPAWPMAQVMARALGLTRS